MKNVKRASIKDQMLYLVLGCSIMALLISGSLAVYGMLDIKANAVNIGMEIGEDAAERSSTALKKLALDSLQGLVHERSKRVDQFFVDMKWDVTVLTNQMNNILANPQDYSQRAVDEPSRENDGVIVPQLQYREGADRASLAGEVALTANLKDFQLRLFDGSSSLASNYVNSKNGFNITVDSISATRVDENNNPLPYDPTQRPWYIKAVTENKLVISDVFSDSQGRGLAIACSSPYHTPDGEFAGVIGEGIILKVISDIINDTKIGNTGFAFVLNNTTGRLIFSSRTEGEFTISKDMNLNNDPKLLESSDETVVNLAKKMSAGETGWELVKIDGKNYYVAYKTLAENPDWSFGAAIEENEVLAPAVLNTENIDDNTYHFIGILNNSIKMMIIVIAIAFVLIMALVPFAGNKIADVLSKPILILSDGVREIASGNLDKKLDIRTGNELEHLAVCFNAMTDELKTYMDNLTKITAEKERIATELHVAKDIQQGMLPKEFDFERTDFEIFATMNAAKEVGGDFYDFYLLDENHLVITIADVSGKGIPASLFMVISKTMLKNFTTFANNPDDYSAVMACTNDQLCTGNDENMFVTVFFGVLEINTGKFTFVNGGHNPPIVYHAKENTCEYLNVKKNFVLGAMDGIPFAQQEIQLEKGDFIFTYTDGVNEAMNIEHEEYTSERLLNFMNQIDCTEPLTELLKNVRADVAEHVGEAEQSDDITMLALRINL